MPDTTFRSKVEVREAPEVLPEGKETTRLGDESPREEVPYLDYKNENGVPFLVEYFELGKSLYEDPKIGFNEELGLIEKFLEKRINSGEIANDIETVGDELKKLEKVTNLKREKRPIIRIETVAAYIKFLNETDKTKENLTRYGNY